MKILQVANGFPPTTMGGTELHTYQLSKELSSRGHTLHVFCREGDLEHDEYEIIDGEVDGLQVRRVVNNFLKMSSFDMYYKNDVIARQFEQFLDEVLPDLVHFQHCVGLSASLIEIAKSSGVPCVATLHDYWYICPRVQLLRPDMSICPGPNEGRDCAACLWGFSTTRARLRRLYFKIRDRLPRAPLLRAASLLSMVNVPFMGARGGTPPTVDRTRYLRGVIMLCDAITAPSGFLRDVYAQNGIPTDKITVMPLGIDTTPWQNANITPSPLTGRVRFAFIGRLLRHKGVHVLMEAFSTLEDADADLLIYGFEDEGDPYAGELQRLALRDQRIHLMGRYEPHDLPAILANIDAVVIPSLWHETFSIVTREAVLSHRPVIASRVGAIPEIIKEGENGLLFEPGSRDDLGEKLRYFIANRDQLTEASHRADTQIRPMQAYAAEMESLYETIQQASYASARSLRNVPAAP